MIILSIENLLAKSALSSAALILSLNTAMADPPSPKPPIELPEPGWVYAVDARWVVRGTNSSYMNEKNAIGPPGSDKGFEQVTTLGIGGELDLFFPACNSSDGTKAPDLRIHDISQPDYVGVKVEFARLPGRLIDLGVYVTYANGIEAEVKIDFNYNKAIINAFQKAALSGEIRLDNKDIDHLKPHELGRVNRIRIYATNVSITPSPNFAGPDIDWVALREGGCVANIRYSQKPLS